MTKHCALRAKKNSILRPKPLWMIRDVAHGKTYEFKSWGELCNFIIAKNEVKVLKECFSV